MAFRTEPRTGSPGSHRSSLTLPSADTHTSHQCTDCSPGAAWGAGVGGGVEGRALLAQQQQEDMFALVSPEGLTLIPSSPIPSCHPKGNSGACAASTWKSCRSSSISTPSWSRLPSLRSIRNSSALMLSPLRGQPSDLEERQLYFLQPDGPSPWTPFPQPPPSCALWRVVSLGVSKH